MCILLTRTLPLRGNVINLGKFPHFPQGPNSQVDGIARRGRGTARREAFYKSPVKRIPADELPDQAGGGDLVVHISLLNIVQDFYDVLHLVVAALLRLDGGKQGVDVLFQHGQLIERRAVEDHVRVLLEGEDPPLLPLLDGFPHGKGVLDRGAPGLVVPDDAAQQPQIAGGDAVVIVQVQGQQGADIEPENPCHVHILRQHDGIQSVQPLGDDDGILFQPQLLALPLPPARLKIEGGQLHGPASDEGGNVLAEQLAVQGVDVLQVQLAVRPPGRSCPGRYSSRPGS